MKTSPYQTHTNLLTLPAVSLVLLFTSPAASSVFPFILSVNPIYYLSIKYFILFHPNGSICI
jgi:hypothetical protein